MKRQLIFECIEFFTSTHKSNFYSKLFDVIDLSNFREYPSSKFGPKGYSRHALFRAFIVMKCEKFGYISDLLDYLNNNLYIAYLCGFDIFKPLPSYWTFERFIKDTSNSCFSKVMQGLVLNLKELGFIDNSFVSADATPIFANTKLNNPKSFSKNKFHKSNHPKSDKDCQLSVHTASNSHTEKNYDFYWSYKNHVLTDAISGLPIAEVTTADIKELSITVDFLKSPNDWFSLNELYFIADKGYDTKDINNFVRYFLKGHAFIPINPIGSKKHRILPSGNVLCDAGLAMHKDGKQYFDDRIKQKFCCPFRTNKDDSLCPCMHPKYFNGKKNRGYTKYITLGTDYRSSINRDSIFFKEIYSLRTESKRYNSRWKNLNLEKANVRNISSVSNLNTLGHFSLFALATAAIKDGSVNKFKSPSGYKKVA